MQIAGTSAIVTGAASGLGAATSAAGSSTFDPVHSRKLPHEPQKLSLFVFWNPHLEQTITWRSLESLPAPIQRMRSAGAPGRTRTDRRNVRAS